MPWEIKSEGGRYCVYKKGDDEALKCYDERADAEDYLTALYASESAREIAAESYTGPAGPASRYTLGLLDDAAVARKALNGEPILIFPKGVHHRAQFDGAVRRIVVDDTVVGELVQNFAAREQRGIRQSRLPVNEDHQGSRALGWFNQVLALPEGVGATFTWNKKGREALENGEFGYFSVEVYDEMVDRVTGERVYNQIAGGALTNYPFFGQATALHNRGGAGVHSLSAGGDPMSEELEQVKAERNVLQQVLHLFARGDNSLPPATAPGLPDEVRTQLEGLQAQVSQFSTKLTTVESERDAYAARLAGMQEQLQGVQDARAVERFSVLAESFAHLPAATADLAVHLRWLYEADAAGAHREFFENVLRRADQVFGAQFREKGVRQGEVGSLDERLATAADKYMAEHPGIAYRDALQAVEGGV